MKLTKPSRAEILAVCAVGAVLGAFFLPRTFGGPPKYTTVAIPPFRAEESDLATVFDRLDRSLIERGRSTLNQVSWEDDRLKRRPISIETTTTMPLGEVFQRIEKAAGVKIGEPGRCGNCGGPVGGLRVVDARPNLDQKTPRR